mmetsp:Transcript_46039/g.97689  ORF Transcript_46039/g.97689 Transcript_46039/m.97689 type:complete len:1010 (+) Transcript_46039:267-3296(+)
MAANTTGTLAGPHLEMLETLRTDNATAAVLPSLLYKLSSIVLPSAPLSTAPSAAASIASSATGATVLSPPHHVNLFGPIANLLAEHSSRGSAPPLYELEPHVAALAIFFCRIVIINGSLTSSPDGHTSVLGKNWSEFLLRLGMATMLGGMAYLRMDYDLICALHLWSHVLPAVLDWWTRFASGRGSGGVNKKEKKKKKKKGKQTVDATTPPPSLATSIGLSTILLLSLPICLRTCRLFSDPTFLATIIRMTPQYPIKDALHYMFPIAELSASYDIVNSFVSDKESLRVMLIHLLFVTFHIQIGLGHIGIAFLTSEQRRKNMLIRMDVENPPPGDDEVADVAAADEGGHDSHKKKKEERGKKEKFDPSRRFRQTAPSFIFLTVLPYMFQIILFGNLNKFAFINVRNRIHRSVRISELFDHDSHLTAMAGEGAAGPDVYAGSMDTVVDTAYNVFNRKLFSLPKLLLLPGVISRQPLLLVKIFPFILLTDMLKGRIVASVTDKVEQFQREARDVDSVRQKVEQFDLKNAELLRRSGIGATKFTQRRWDELTLEYQAMMAAGELLRRTRGYFMWLQRNFVFVVLIDCALAKLLAEGSIVVAEIFVFSRAIEDVVDLLLIRSRSESELATLMTQVDKLKVLEEVWSKSKEPRLLPCRLGTTITQTAEVTEKYLGGIVLNNLQYSRGTASVSTDHLVIEPGIYAVTGANGSGKSTLFRLLMACDSNERPIDLHESIELFTPLHQWDLSDRLILPEESCKVLDEGCEVVEKGDTTMQDGSASLSAGTDSGEPEEVPVTSITLPSSDIEEISQTFYWPLYSKPIDWIYQKHVTSDLNEAERRKCVRRVAEELQSLSFAQSQEASSDVGDSEGVAATLKTADKGYTTVPGDSVVERLMAELQEEKEDWFSELSGGQKSKVELVRKVFLREKCPSVLLVDETMAPLDPASKSQVMSKLKSFCHESVVLVIYHTDVGRGATASADASGSNGDGKECVPSNSFFDHNLHVENKRLATRPVC